MEVELMEIDDFAETVFSFKVNSAEDSKSCRDLTFEDLEDLFLFSSAVEVPLNVCSNESDLNNDELDNFLELLGTDPTYHTAPVTASNESYVEDLQDDPDAMEIYRQIYSEDAGHSAPQLNQLDAQPMRNALLEKSQLQEFSLPSPSSSISCSEPLPVTADRETEIGKMAEYIKTVIERSNSTKSEGTSSKLKVHEVILVVLLNHGHGDKTMDLRRILAFCDDDGHEVSGTSWHFKTLDTETMGALWMKIKGNRNASYDTFARAMRVRREKAEGKKSNGYFDYLGSGLRSKKRVYRFGDKAMEDMDRIKQTLKLFS